MSSSKRASKKSKKSTSTQVIQPKKSRSKPRPVGRPELPPGERLVTFCSNVKPVLKDAYTELANQITALTGEKISVAMITAEALEFALPHIKDKYEISHAEPITHQPNQKLLAKRRKEAG